MVYCNGCDICGGWIVILVWMNCDIYGGFMVVGVSTPGGSLDRRVNCRRVPQPRWVGARRSTKGGKPEGDRRKRGNHAAFVFVPRPGRVRLQ